MLIILPERLACSWCVEFMQKILVGGDEGGDRLKGLSELGILAWLGDRLEERGTKERSARSGLIV